MSSSLRPTLYQAIISLLNQSEDLVVRIEAAMTLKTDILYHVKIFNDYLQYVLLCTCQREKTLVQIRSVSCKQEFHDWYLMFL